MPAPARWDFYEITFSLPDGDEDAALSLFENFEKLAGVKGAVFSGGNYGPHPFSKAAVEKACRVLAEYWPDDFDPADRGTPNGHAKTVVETVLSAASHPSAAPPRKDETK